MCNKSEDEMKNYISTLAGMPLFQGIEENDILSLLNCLNGKVKSYTKDSIILFNGDDLKYMGIILSGHAHILKEDILGNRNLISNLREKDLFGESLLCAGVEKSPLTIVAITECEVLFLDFRPLIRTCPNTCSFHNKLIENMLRIIANKNLFLNKKLSYLSCKSIREKLSAYLLDCFKDKGEYSFSINYNRNQLANFLSIDRSAMCRELSKMKSEGIIDFWKNSFKIINLEALVKGEE